MTNKKSVWLLASLLFLGNCVALAQGFAGSSFLDEMAKLKNYERKRVSSYDRTGKNTDCLKIGAGETVELAKIEGAGIIKHIWITLSSEDPMIRRNAVLSFKDVLGWRDGAEW